MSLPFPVALLNHHTAILGKTGSGKSSKARVAVEYQLRKKLPVNIIDPKGDWYGLKSSADGKGPGFPVVIFGGQHADVPITANSGAQVAKMIFSGNFPSLIDQKGWMPSDRARFFIDYVSEIFKDSYGNRPMVIDECHNYAPKGKILSPQAAEMLHWANRLASEGRGLGLNVIFASQRPQKVHNDLLTSCETLIACKVIHKADRDAVKDWIDGCADKELGAQVMSELASLPKPEAWVWCPEILFGPRKVTFPMFETYDSFAPQAKMKRKLRGWAKVDIDKMKGQLATVIEEATANDPATLNRTIADLRKQLAAEQRKKAAPDRDASLIGKVNDLTALLNTERNKVIGLNKHVKALNNALDGVKELARQSHDMLGRVPNVIGHVTPLLLVEPAKPVKSVGQVTPATYPKVIKKEVSEVVRADASGIMPAQQRILDQLEWLLSKGISPAPKEMLAAMCKVRATSGGFMQNLANLNKAGLISYPTPGLVAATQEGRRAAAQPADLDRPIHESWLAITDGKQREILQTLIDKYPNPVAKPDLAVLLNVKHTSGGFMQNLADLKTIGAICYPEKGMVAPSKYVMPEEP